MIGWPRPYQRPISTKKEAEPFIRQLYAELPWARTPRQRDGASRLCGRLRQGQTTERRARSCPHQPQSDWMQAGTVSGLRICWSSSDMKSGSEMPPRFVPVVCIFWSCCWRPDLAANLDRDAAPFRLLWPATAEDHW